MDYNSDYNPTHSVSDIKTNPFSESISSELENAINLDNSNLAENELDSEIASSSASISQNKDIDSRIYIFKNGLFKQTILPNIEGNNREMQIECTM